MATAFPTGLDAFPNPSGNDLLNNAVSLRKHSIQHGNENDAIEALETKVGIDNSLDSSSFDFRIQALEVLPPGSTGPTGPTGATGATGAAQAPVYDIVELLSATSFCSFNRKFTNAVMSRTSQRMYVSAFTCPLSITTSSVSIFVDVVGTASTSTLLGLYSIDASDNGTLIASTANDTTFLNSTGVRTKSWSVPVALTAGNRYAFALLQDGGTQAQVAKLSSGNALVTANLQFTVGPFCMAYRTGQTSLIAFTKAALTASPDYMYFSLSA